jgi:hypothetical protein
MVLRTVRSTPLLPFSSIPVSVVSKKNSIKNYLSKNIAHLEGICCRAISCYGINLKTWRDIAGRGVDEHI